MTLEEIENSLPWGLHDAYRERIEIDWLAQRAVLRVRLMLSEHQDLDQRAHVVVDGLVYCSIDPEIDPARGYDPMPAAGLWLGSGPRTVAIRGGSSARTCWMLRALVLR